MQKNIYPNHLSLALYYKKYKNNFTKMVRLAKFKFFGKKLKIASSNQKLTWKVLNEVTGSKLRSTFNIIKIKIMTVK